MMMGFGDFFCGEEGCFSPLYHNKEDPLQSHWNGINTTKVCIWNPSLLFCESVLAREEGEVEVEKKGQRET